MPVEQLAGHDVARVRAQNPGPLTLDGSNSWAVGRDRCWVVDTGPGLEAHLDELAEEVARRGGLGGVALTHDHADHAGGVAGLLSRAGEAPVGAVRQPVVGSGVTLADGDVIGPFTAIASPGHSPDHLAFVAGPACFTGDAVLGAGSVFVSPGPGSLAGYLAALRRLRALPLEVLCPGHGPPVLDAAAKLDEYIAHRLDRERRLVEALDRGLRGEEELLDAAWDDAPAALRPAATLSLRAHLHKLGEEGRLPPGMAAPRSDEPAPAV